MRSIEENPMHFVAFHVEPGAAALAQIEESCRTFHADTDYRRLLSVLFESAELFHPGARHVVLSDERTPFDSLPRGVQVRRCAVDPDRVMYSRLVAQIDYLRQHADEGGVFFLDADMVVNADLGALFRSNFDIGLTYRDDAEMPLNGGVIVVRPGARQAAIGFLERVRGIYETQFASAVHWWGDQQALIAAVGAERFRSRSSDQLAIDGVRVRLLPCGRYNFSPENEEQAISRPLSDKAILHFKGERKRLMPLYWEKYYQPTRSAMSQPPVRVFVGSGEASLLERKVLIHSLRKNTSRKVDVYVMNGTHNAIEKNDEPPVPAPMSLRVKYRNYTEFSLYRYLIPQLCGHEGRGIYVDSDMITLGDIGQLFDMPMHGCDFLSIKAYDTGQWGPSVMLIDCSRCRFDLEQICDEIDAGKYTYSEFTRMDDRFLAHHPLRIGVLDPNWNVFDRCDEHTKLIHYTDLMSQPWKFPGHPHGQLWFDYLQDAIAAGDVTQEDITKSITRGHIRANIRDGNQVRLAVARQGVTRNAMTKRKPGFLKRLSRRLRGKAA